MAWDDAYATAAQYRDALTKSDTADDAEILDNLKAISRYLEQKLSRVFNQSAADQNKDFDGNGLSHLYIPDFVSLSATTPVSVDSNADGTFDETTLVAADILLWPYNAAAESWPFTRLELASWSVIRTIWPSSKRAVRIKGLWGWPTVPLPIKTATIQLTGILRVEGPRATSRIQEGIDNALEMSWEAKRIVSELSNHYGKVTV